MKRNVGFGLQIVYVCARLDIFYNFLNTTPFCIFSRVTIEECTAKELAARTICNISEIHVPEATDHNRNNVFVLPKNCENMQTSSSLKSLCIT